MMCIESTKHHHHPQIERNMNGTPHNQIDRIHACHIISQDSTVDMRTWYMIPQEWRMAIYIHGMWLHKCLHNWWDRITDT